jgi:hypothetical protein
LVEADGLEVGEQALGAMAQDALLDLDDGEQDKQDGEGREADCAENANDSHANLYTCAAESDAGILRCAQE